MKLILASDLDGTLVREKIIPNDNIISLKNLKSSENLFIISTGRPYNGVEQLVSDYDLDVDYYALLNGALILDKNQNILKHDHISFDVINEIVGLVNKYDPKMSIETGFTTYTLGKNHDNLPYNKKLCIDSICDVDNENISLLSLYFDKCEIQLIDDICSEINSKYSHYCEAFRNTNYVDVVPLGCSKGNAIKFISDMEQLDSRSVYTIGDSFNDVSMFNITKNSFTFYECEESLKNLANNIVESVSDCIENHMLNKVYAK